MKTIFLSSREISAALKARISYELSQKELAMHLGISQAYLSDVLAGRREVGPTILKALGYEETPFYRQRPHGETP